MNRSRCLRAALLAILAATLVTVAPPVPAGAQEAPPVECPVITAEEQTCDPLEVIEIFEQLCVGLAGLGCVSPNIGEIIVEGPEYSDYQAQLNFLAPEDWFTLRRWNAGAAVINRGYGTFACYDVCHGTTFAVDDPAKVTTQAEVNGGYWWRTLGPVAAVADVGRFVPSYEFAQIQGSIDVTIVFTHYLENVVTPTGGYGVLDWADAQRGFNVSLDSNERLCVAVRETTSNFVCQNSNLSALHGTNVNVAITITASGSVTFWVNGTNYGTFAAGTTMKGTDFNARISPRYWFTGQNPRIGYYRDLALFNRVLSSSEIIALHAQTDIEPAPETVVEVPGGRRDHVPGTTIVESPNTTRLVAPDTIPGGVTPSTTTDKTLGDRIGGFFGNLINNLWGGLQWTADKLASGLVALGNQIVDKLQMVYNGLAQVLNSVGAAITGMLVAVFAAVMTVATTITNMITWLKDQLVAVLEDILGALADLLAPLLGILQDAFVPSEWNGPRSAAEAWDDSIGALIGGPIDAIGDGWSNATAALDATPDCEGPTLNVPGGPGWAGFEFKPLNACEGVPATVAGFVRPFMLFLIYLGAALKAFRFVLRGSGADAAEAA